MKPVTTKVLRRQLLTAATGIVLVAAGGTARASTQAELLQTAETACLEEAASQGWRTDQASVVSRRAIDSDRVEIVLDLTKDGVNQARLTCPFSASTGGVAQFGAVGDQLTKGGERTDFGKDFTRSMATAADTAQAVNRVRGWWLLLPIGLAGLSWAVLRGRAADDV
jgi:hypothetical protein